VRSFLAVQSFSFQTNAWPNSQLVTFLLRFSVSLEPRQNNSKSWVAKWNAEWTSEASRVQAVFHFEQTSYISLNHFSNKISAPASSYLQVTSLLQQSSINCHDPWRFS
jgi:hypothetical protein